MIQRTRQDRSPDPMKIIVAGCPKTGTKSVNAALKRLGFSVFDFVEHLYCLEEEWGSVFSQGWDEDTFRKMYQDVDAAVDMPASLFWEQIHEAFPDAKIILTVRDSEEAWFRSFENHFRRLDSAFLLRVVQLIEILLQRKTGLLLNRSYKFGFDVDRALFRRRTPMNESVLKMRYRSHNDRVMQKAPADKLLVFNCKEGWGPLCDFLGVPPPEEAFPCKNVKGAVIEESMRHPLALVYQKEVFASLIVFVVKLVVGLSLFLFIA